MTLRHVGASLLALLLQCTATAGELADLGQGLAYLRIKSLDESLKTTAAALRERDALVLDVRYATASAESAGAIQAALAARGTRPAIFLLVSPQTPAALASLPHAGPKSFLVLGIAASRPSPQVVVDQPADSDRRAYDAADTGHALHSLLSGKIEKDRYDEASLVRDFKNGNPEAEPPPAPDPTTTKPSEPGSGKAQVLVDRVLQRAVHLHRALLALKPGAH